jgi:small subunit ribosomal protein S21
MIRHTARLSITNAYRTKNGKEDQPTMAIRVKARGGESVEGMLRRFKKLCEKEGLTKDIKRKAFYEKPSERRNRAARKSARPVTPRPIRPAK